MNDQSRAQTAVGNSLSKHLKRLESESIEIMREVVAEFKRPVMLYSIGKDSSVMLHLAIKAFYPGAAAVSALACGYYLEIPGDDRVPRRRRRGGSISIFSFTSTRTALSAALIRLPPVHLCTRT